MNEMELLSSVDALPNNCDPSTVLCTLSGPFADYSVPTGNGYWYSSELYDKVLESSNWKEFSSNRVNLAEGDHPSDAEDRSAIYLPKVSHAYRDVYNDKVHQKVMGKVDILDTPVGRILYTLVKYGAKLGISSRGEGDLIVRGANGSKYQVTQDEESGSLVKVDVYGNSQPITVDDRIEVDPDTYVFYAWDIVHQPSNAAARLDLLVDRNSCKTPIKESITKKPSLMPLFESIKNNKQALKEVEQVVSQSDAEDKVQMTSKLNEYIDMLNGPETDPRDEVITKLKSDISDLSSRYIKLETAYNTLKSKAVQTDTDELASIISNQTNSIEGNTQLIESITDDILSRVEEVYNNLIVPLYEIKNNLNKVVISNQDERRIAEEYYNRIITSNQGIARSIQDIPVESAVHVDESSISYLSEQLQDSLAKVAQLELDNERLTESNKSLNNKLRESQAESDQLSKSKSDENRQYLKLRCDQLGLKYIPEITNLDSMKLTEIDSALSSIYGQTISQIGDVVKPIDESKDQQLLNEALKRQAANNSTPVVRRNESLMRVIANNAD